MIVFFSLLAVIKVEVQCRNAEQRGAYDAPPDPLVVRGFLPSAIAVSRLRRLNPVSPPKQKYPPH